MENSFFEYRDKSAVASDSDTEIIDNSLVVECRFSSKKIPGSAIKNRTVFVAESEESSTDESDKDQDEIQQKEPKSVLRRSSIHNPHVILSSDDDGSKRGSIRRQSSSSPNKLVMSSSDEEVSPELVPRRRPPVRPKSTDSPSDSFIGRMKSKKRMILLDSDTENSIVIEHDKNRKLACLKDTPLKVDSGKKIAAQSDEDMTTDDDENDASNVSDGEDDDDDDENSNDDENSDDDEEPDEDQMVMSRATRMSIMGVIPKENDSDESDFIQSDESKPNSRPGSACSLTDLPDVSTCIRKSPHKPGPEAGPDPNDTTRLTCSPFSSPLKDITNEINESKDKTIDLTGQNTSIIGLDLKENESQALKSKVLNNLTNVAKASVVDDDDDDVTIIDSKPEIIALSSDDEYEHLLKNLTSIHKFLRNMLSINREVSR